ncbi:MAG: peptidoglycan editing factor PgeF [bacterium]|nr:peptidoglycan editing factor PgeF [bacterium]
MILFTLFPNNIIVGFSERKDGSMKFSVENRENFFNKLGINKELVVRIGLVHKNKVALISKKEAGKIIEKTDGLITKEKNIFLTITTADCLPIFIYDPEKEIIGLIHGGWRNLADNILKEAIDKITNNFKSNPAHILIGIGPGISQCHFEVKKDLLQKLCDRAIFARGVVSEKDDKIFLDLKELAKLQLIKLGIKERNIEISPECTFCLKTKYFSYRRDKPEKVQAMLAIIGQK